MKPAPVVRLLLLVILFAMSSFRGPTNLFHAQSGQSNDPVCCGGVAPRELDFSYYTLRDGFNSTLLLVSASPNLLNFILAIHSRSGQTVLAPSLTIQPQEKLSLDVAQLLTNAAADVVGDFSEGSISVYFTGTIMPLAGQLTMSNPTRRLTLQAEMVDNSPGLSVLPLQLNALWWGIGGGRDAKVMVANTEGSPATADVFLDYLGERHSAAPLTFAPHETKVLSISDLLGELKTSPAQAPEGGISIVPRGPAPSLIAQGRITDVVTGFSTTLHFPDPSLQRVSALHASGVPIGMPSKDSPYVGTGVYIPHVIVRNLTGSPQNVAITIEYPGKDGPAQEPLAPLALGAYQTKDIPLDAAFGLLPLPVAYSSVRIQYSGPPGSAIGEVASIESNGNTVIDSHVANEGDYWRGSGAQPWHLDKETESILFLTNMGEEACRFGFRVQASGVPYHVIDLKLAPHETRAIDMRQLRDAQKADFQKNKMPAEATDGSVYWIRLDNVPVMGRMLVLQKHHGMSSNYDCSTCPCPPNSTATFVTPQYYDLGIGFFIQDLGTATFSDCNGQNSYYDVTSSSSWSSDTPSVATVNNTTSKGKVTGVAGGTATVTGSYTGVRYVFSPVTGCKIIGNPLFQSNQSIGVISVSQSPSAFNMSTGDTGHISVTVNPPNVSVTLSFSGTSSPTSNPSSSGAVTLTASGSGSGTINSSVTASPAGKSGVFSVTASASGVQSGSATTVNVPPQVLIQMMYGEANAAGSEAQLAVGIAARNRFGNSYFSGDTTYQNTIVSSQFQGISTTTTTGVSPELGNAVQVWLNQIGNIISPSGGSASACFWTPTAAEWSQISAAVSSGTTNEAQVPNDTGCFSGATYNQQIRVVTAVGGNSSGVPWFVFQGPRSSASSPVAIQF